MFEKKNVKMFTIKTIFFFVHVTHVLIFADISLHGTFDFYLIGILFIFIQKYGLYLFFFFFACKIPLRVLFSQHDFNE